MFSIGQRVRCVDGAFSYNALDWAERFPVTGAAYTVRAIAAQPHYLDRSFDLAVWLVEIVNPPLTDGAEPSFSASRFRVDQEMAVRDAAANDTRWEPSGRPVQKSAACRQVEV